MKLNIKEILSVIPVSGNRQFLNPSTAEAVKVDKDEMLHFKPHELKILLVKN